MRFALLFAMMYIVQQTVKVYQVRDDLDKVVETLLILLINTDAVYKHITLWKNADKVEKLVRIKKGPIFNQKVRDHEHILAQTVRFSRIFLRAFNVTALITCALWVVYRIILYTKGIPEEFTFWLPFDTNTGLRFYAAVFYMWFQTCFVAITNTTMDALISFFFAQSKTQLAILRLDLENLVQGSKEESKHSSKPYHQILRIRFHKLLLHYNEIVLFTSSTASIVNGPLLYQFLVSGWIICTTAYKTVHINPVSIEFASMILYMGCIVAEIFIFCHFGNEVSWESACVMDSAYMMNWMEFPIPLRKDLFLFMERLKRPIIPRAGSLIPLSNTVFVSIMRSSYSFYVLLKNSS